MRTCKIQWVKSGGNPTSHDVPATGVVRCTSFDREGKEIGFKEFPICSEHLSKMPRGHCCDREGRKVSKWEFVKCFECNGLGLVFEGFYVGACPNGCPCSRKL